MANRKNLKKEIKILLNDVIEECFLYAIAHPGKNEKELDSIIDDAADIHDALIERVSDYKKEVTEAKNIRQFFNQINKDLYENYVALMGRVDKLTS